jgi:hypothetical protein
VDLFDYYLPGFPVARGPNYLCLSVVCYENRIKKIVRSPRR